jgi:hypothetical protein
LAERLNPHLSRITDIRDSGMLVRYHHWEGRHTFSWKVKCGCGNTLLVTANENGVQLRGTFFSPVLINGRPAEDMKRLLDAINRAKDIHQQLVAERGFVDFSSPCQRFKLKGTDKANPKGSEGKKRRGN